MKNPQQAPLLPQASSELFVLLEVFPRDVPGHPLKLSELQPQLGQHVLLLHQIKAGEVAPEAALHQLPCLVEVMALQQVEHHAVTGRELADQRISRAGGQLTGFPNALKTALNGDDIAPGIKAATPSATGHLQELTAHQRTMTPFRALGQGRDHGGASRHVDTGGQGLRGEDHLDQALLEQLFDQLLPSRKHTGMVRRDAPEQSIGMDAIPHRLRVVAAVGLKSRPNPGLFLLVDQALDAEIANSLVATAATEDEIDGGEHVPFRHLRHHKTDRRRLRLRRFGGASLAFVTLRRTPDLAVGMQSGSSIIQQRMQSLGTAEAELQRHRPIVTEHQGGWTMHLLDPIGELPGIGDRRRQSHQLHRRRAVNDRLLPDRAALGVIHVMALIQHHGFHIRQRVVLFAGFRVEHVAEDLRGHHHD